MEVELPVSDNVILLGHGTINLDLPINEETGFICPDNVKIMTFDLTGDLLNRWDAGFLYNYLVHKIHKGDNLESADNKAININLKKIIGSYGESDFSKYYARLYKPGDFVMNVDINFDDSTTQTGIFNVFPGG